MAYGVVGLADVVVKSGNAGDVDGAAIFEGRARFILDADICHGCMDETEWRADLDLQDDVPCTIRHRVYHAITGKTSCGDEVK